MRQRAVTRYIRSIFIGLAALTVVLLVLFPVYWIMVSAFKPNHELISPVPTFWPRNFTFENVVTLFTASNFLTYTLNSIIVSMCTAIVTLVLSILGAYSLSRFDYPGRKLFGRLILFTYIFPGMLLLIPMYSIMQGAGLANTLTGLVVVNVMISCPFGVWVLKSFMDSIPVEMEQAAMVDGANRFQALTKVLLPVVLPGLGTIVIYSFITSWAEYMFPLILISDEAKKTVPLGLAQWMSMYSVEWGAITAGVTVSTIPVLLLFALIGKSFIRGLTQGALKG
ncbi:MAG: carbohydrate ABC transporter permease [Limnochordia bacterium]|jgi:multiple sugar transport system permease protein